MSKRGIHIIKKVSISSITPIIVVGPVRNPGLNIGQQLLAAPLASLLDDGTLRHAGINSLVPGKSGIPIGDGQANWWAAAGFHYLNKQLQPELKAKVCLGILTAVDCLEQRGPHRYDGVDGTILLSSPDHTRGGTFFMQYTSTDNPVGATAKVTHLYGDILDFECQDRQSAQLLLGILKLLEDYPLNGSTAKIPFDRGLISSIMNGNKHLW